MIVSTKGRYALRVMLDLASQDRAQFVPLKEIADRQGISEKYLESIVSGLTKAGFLEGLRGKGGGYRLTRSPEQYTVDSILELTEGSLAPVSCLEKGTAPCPNSSVCLTFPMWSELDKLIHNFFRGITLAELLASANTDSLNSSSL